VSFPGLKTSTYANTYIIGQSVNARKVYEYLGVDPLTGEYQFLDVDNNGSFNSADRTAVVKTDPDFYGGFSNEFSYKGFSASFLIEFRKQTGFNYLASQTTFVPGYNYTNQPVTVLNRWQMPGDISNVQRFTATSTSYAFTAASSLLGGSNGVYSDASYGRLKNLELSYSISEAQLKKRKIESLRFYISGENLLTVTRYLGADPENQSFLILPPLKTIAIGIQIQL
jgi:hypothetical protein